MSDPSIPISPSKLPPLSDVYFRRLFIPIVITLVVLVFIYVMISVPTSVDDGQTFIGGGTKNLLKKLLSIK